MLLKSPRSKLLAVSLAISASAIVSLFIPGSSTSAHTEGPATAAELWSLGPIKQVAPPAVKDSSWPINDVDRFLLATLESKGVKPNAPADKRQLLRRATFDLTGLPPTPEEIDAFLADNSPQAFEKVVDRLLASPAYGEKCGRHWLDVARYADTAGDGADYPIREAYKYRDWVINAFNQDKPFDQFVREQIAGDLIAKDAAGEAYRDGVVATGYLAISKRFGYNAAKNDFQHLDIADTIDVLGRSFLGLSIGCARCHDHKFEPISMADYYGLYGIFASSQYTFPGGEETKHPEHLVSLVAPAELKKLEAEKQQQVAGLDAKIKAIADQRNLLSAKVGGRGGADYALELQEIGKPLAAPWFSQGKVTVLAEAQSPFTNVYSVGSRGVRVEAGASQGDGVRARIDPLRTAANAKVLHLNVDFRNVTPADKAGAYRFFLAQGAITSLALEFCVSSDAFSLRNGDHFEEIRKIQPGAWYNVRLAVDLEHKTYSGSVGTPGDITTFEGKGFMPGWNGNIDTFVVDGYGNIPGPVPTHDLDNLAIDATPFEPPVTAAVGSAVTAEELVKIRAKLAELDKSIAEIEQQKQEITKKAFGDVAYAVVEGQQPANAKVQLRGDPKTPGPEVSRHFLACLGGDALPPDSKGSGRLELAQWLTRPSNPLTPRVMVNRIWQWHFGQGLVRTPSDFGSRGERPSHPELLDWLAARFISDGWSIKKMHRLIMLSRAYQMSSGDDPSARAADPEDRLLWRFPRRRLDAEEVRDAMLTVAGTLDRSPGGPHPFPPVESWAFTIHNPFYAVYESNHRSVYLMVQRQKRHPFLALFDAPDPNISVDARPETITPKQALYLMNDPFVHDRSTEMAKRVLAFSPEHGPQLKYLWTMCAAREPTDDERMAAVNFITAYAQRLAGAGKEMTDAQRLAAWAAYVRVVMTSNEFLYVD